MLLLSCYEKMNTTDKFPTSHTGDNAKFIFQVHFLLILLLVNNLGKWAKLIKCLFEFLFKRN